MLVRKLAIAYIYRHKTLIYYGVLTYKITGCSNLRTHSYIVAEPFICYLRISCEIGRSFWHSKLADNFIFLRKIQKKTPSIRFTPIRGGICIRF